MRLRHIIAALGAPVLAAACGLTDLFQSPGPSDVALTYTGPAVLNVDDRTPVAVSVLVGGSSLPNPRLLITSSDTAIIALSADGDTLIARSRGFDTLTIRLLGSIYTDSFPTILQPIRVNP
jgi:hypothetical protein